MTEAIIQYVFYIVLLILLAIPLGKYIGKVMRGDRVLLTRIFEPCENFIYKIARIKKDEEMDWKNT